MAHYVGLAVGLRTTALCIVDAGGAVRLERSVPSEVDDIAGCRAGFGGAIEAVALEAGTLTQWLTQGLRAAGCRVVVLEARQVKATLSSLRCKTARNDARGIARILRTGWCREVHVKGLDSQRTRVLLSARKALLHRCIDVENEIRGLLRVFGVRLPARLRHGQYGRGVRVLLGRAPALAHALEPILDCRLRIHNAWRELERRVTAMAKEDRICRLLMTAPGVGPITAMTFKAAVDDPGRFRRAKTVAARFGLTPRRQSGERDDPGRISRVGDAGVRSALFVAANSVMTRSAEPSRLKSWRARLSRTKGRKRAVVAVARKLVVILHAMWSDGTEFCHGAREAAA
jgi:transposase